MAKVTSRGVVTLELTWAEATALASVIACVDCIPTDAGAMEVCSIGAALDADDIPTADFDVYGKLSLAPAGARA